MGLSFSLFIHFCLSVNFLFFFFFSFHGIGGEQGGLV